MKAKTNYPPKIVRPGTAKILKRDRLFKILDNARQQSTLIWVAAPAGSGKTTLLTSYIQEYQLRHCWYQVDEGDRDLPTFFHYLGQAGEKAAPRRKKNMPVLTAEYLQNIAAFTRRFFADMSSRLKEGGVIVLDNFQLFTESHPIHALLPNIVDSLAQGISLIVISRELSSKSLAPLLVRGQLTTLDTRQVRFDHDEWKKVCHLLQPESDNDTLLALHSRLDGWVAGLLLALNAPKVFDNISSAMAKANVLENYIGDEFLSSLDVQANELLMSVCYMSHITLATLKMLTKINNPQGILTELARKNLFILQQGDKGYTLHPLVREQLKRRVKNTLTKKSLRDLQLASANAMLQQNEYESAADLLLELKEWKKLIAVILAHAEALYNAGRVIPLEYYISTLPSRYSANEAWIDYWNGSLLVYRDVKSALEFYDNAYLAFLSSGNTKGAYLTWYAALATICRTLQGGVALIGWLNRYDELSNKWPQPPQELQNGCLENMLAKSYFMTNIDVQKREFWRKKLLLAINETSNPVAQLQMMSNYITIAAISGIKEQDALIFEKLGRGLSETEGIPIILYLDAIVASNIYIMSINDHARLLAQTHQTLKISASSGVSVFNGLLYMGYSVAAVNLKNFSLAKKYLEISEQNMPEKDLTYKASYLMALCHAGTYIDELKDINKTARKFLATLDDVLLPAFTIHIKLAYIYYLCMRLQTDEAFALHDELLDQVTRQALPAQISRFHMIYAKILFKMGLTDKSDYYLEKSITILSAENIISYCYWPSELMTWACQRALALDIETSYVDSFITWHYSILPAPDSLSVKWPWAFRLYTFGYFEFIQKTKGDNKSQRINKSFQLLRALAAAEKNTLSVVRLKETLYGEYEYNKASRLLDNHIHRLRKSLECDAAIIRQGDYISLNLQYFWVDKNAFEALQKQNVNSENAFDLATQIQLIYRGDYMQEDDSVDCIAHRERYRNLFMSMTFKCLDFMESNPKRAIDICLQSLIREPFSETLYRKLIGSYLLMGNKEMAETTLLQCRDIMQRHMNKEVSAETLSLLSNI